MKKLKNYPPAFIESMEALLGAEYPAFAAAMDAPPCAALRLNPARAGTEDMLQGALDGVVPWEADGRYVRHGFRPGRDPLHFAGGYYMQEPSAMAAARVLNARPGERVLDLCAAPGGKSGQIAAALGGAGVLVAGDPDAARARVLAGNLERLGVPNAAVVSANPVALAARWPGVFDAVLVDAPCSGEGMFRRDPETISQWTSARAAGCAARQRALLTEAAKLVAPGGRLVYSTCTFNAAENEDNVQWLLSQRADFHAVEFALPGVGASADGCMRLWPHRLRGEGHFVALLAREGEMERVAARRPRVEAEAARAFDMLKEAVPGTWHERFADYDLVLLGDRLWARPVGLPDMAGVKALTQGLLLARVGRGYVQPEHALAMAVDPARVDRRAEVDARRYIAGETLAGDLRGWTLATWRGLALGWVKGSDGQLKNHLPKGLRAK